MTLKRLSLLVAIALGCCLHGTAATRALRAGFFASLRTTGPLPVELRQVPDSAGIVVITASERALPQVKIANTDGTLCVDYEHADARDNYAREVRRVVVYCGRELHTVATTGSGTVSIGRLHTSTELTAVATGSGKLTLAHVDCLNFTGSLTGSGALVLDGLKARNISTSCMGSGRIVATGVDANAFNCTLSGSGTASIAGHAAKASLALRGSGVLKASALDCANVSVSASGSGSIRYNPATAHIKVLSGRNDGNGTVSR